MRLTPCYERLTNVLQSCNTVYVWLAVTHLRKSLRPFNEIKTARLRSYITDAYTIAYGRNDGCATLQRLCC